MSSSKKGGDIAGKHILVTAGPTWEFIDEVRFISNPSTGRMGFALATCAKEYGAKAILISGPTQLQPPNGVKLIPVISASEMRDAVLDNFAWADVLIMAAAVTDYRPAKRREGKVKKESEKTPLLELELTPDIASEVGGMKEGKVVVGFAGEVGEILENAKRKLKEKNFDLIVANDLTLPDAGFGVETNIVTIIDREGKIVNYPKLAKGEVAGIVLDRVGELLFTRSQ